MSEVVGMVAGPFLLIAIGAGWLVLLLNRDR